MLINLIFTYYFTLVSVKGDLASLSEDLSLDSDGLSLVSRYPRAFKKKDEFLEITHTCEQMGRTSLSPFVVILLLQTSGRFLGMGSIIDKKTILTANHVVKSFMYSPTKLLVLAGRRSPWWGKDSQVKQASDIFQNDAGLAMIAVKHPFNFNRNIAPIRLPTEVVKDLSTAYGKLWAIFGIPRSSWDVPGDSISKGSIYYLKLENGPEKKPDSDACKAAYPDLEYNDTVNQCTFANGSFSWGCIGSPLISVGKDNKLLQIGVLTRATMTEKDEFHIHVNIGFYDQWIKSHSLRGFERPKI